MYFTENERKKLQTEIAEASREIIYKHLKKEHTGKICVDLSDDEHVIEIFVELEAGYTPLTAGKAFFGLSRSVQVHLNESDKFPKDIREWFVMVKPKFLHEEDSAKDIADLQKLLNSLELKSSKSKTLTSHEQA